MEQDNMTASIEIRAVRPEDSDAWVRMRRELWPSEPDDHEQEARRFFSDRRTNPLEVLLAFYPSGKAIGFLELSIRSYAEGCTTDRVAYIEGWFVDGRARRTGAGAALVKAAEAWARTMGCTEIASDAEIANETSIRAHTALGFAETGRMVCFRKALTS